MSSVLRVRDEGCWAELAAVGDLEGWTEVVLDSRTRRMAPAFDCALPELRAAGVDVLVRYARRTAEEVQTARAEVAETVASLRPRTRVVLERAARAARDGLVRGGHAWDPVHEATHVDALTMAGLVTWAEGELRAGTYRVHPDLVVAEVPYDFEEAAMPPTEDLCEARPGPIALLHDLAALSAALAHHTPRRTHAGTVDVSTAKKLGRRLGDTELAATGKLSGRWLRALGALEALGAVEMDPGTRRLHLEPGVDELLRGDTAAAVERLVTRLVEPDLAAWMPAVRAALRTAGPDGAVDELIFLELVGEQHRDVVFAPWIVDGVTVYPALGGRKLPWTDEAFEQVEGPLLEELLGVLVRLGLVRRAEGVFAPTPDGVAWATGSLAAASPVWVSSDLEVLVPPGSVTPWERYQIERLGRCLGRDVVDRYRLERVGLEQWLRTHELAEALDLLRRRAPGLPASVTDTLQAWEQSVTRFVLTRGVRRVRAPRRAATAP